MWALQTQQKDLDYFPGTVESYCRILSKKEMGLICILEK